MKANKGLGKPGVLFLGSRPLRPFLRLCFLWLSGGVICCLFRFSFIFQLLPLGSSLCSQLSGWWRRFLPCFLFVAAPYLSFPHLLQPLCSLVGQIKERSPKGNSSHLYVFDIVVSGYSSSRLDTPRFLPCLPCTQILEISIAQHVLLHRCAFGDLFSLLCYFPELPLQQLWIRDRLIHFLLHVSSPFNEGRIHTGGGGFACVQKT